MAAKIKDGLFIGDAETSQSEVFINDNKISNLINLSGREVHNVWASHGLVYLTYYWEDRPDYKLFSSHEDALLTDIVEFIDVSISHGISVLLFSRNGTGRCVVAACLYLMMKYRWGFEKTYDYVYSKKPDIDLNKGFIQQMFALDMKLLAARQKAQAIKHGVDNGFKIEANMTISDISAMLPPLEAKRWNAWDPNYVLESADHALRMDGESKGELGRFKGSKSEHKLDSRRGSPAGSGGLVRSGTSLSGPGTGEDDELILIYSFINSKNTITVLPGPYLDVYEIPKNFKLKFNPVCFEEDVNWFPNSSTVPARVVLKGSRARIAMQAQTALAQPKSASQGKVDDRDSKRFIDAKALDALPAPSHSGGGGGMAYTAGAKSAALENIAPMHVIRSQREAAAAESLTSGNGHGHNPQSAGAAAQMYYAHPSMSSAPGQAGEAYYNPDHSPPSSTYNSPSHTKDRTPTSNLTPTNANNTQSPTYSNDLYEFVGISTDQGSRGKTSREAPQRTWGPRDSIAIHRDNSSSSIQSAGPASTNPSPPQRSAGADHKESAYDQPDRSRHHQQQQGAAPVPARASANQPLTAEDRLRNLMADMQRHKTGGGSAAPPGPNSERERGERGPSGPSLYELATMQIPPSAGGGGGGGGGAGRQVRRDTYEQDRDIELDGLDQDDESDPLSAFQRIQDQPYSVSGAGRGPSSSSGAVRARHDVITGRPGSAGASGRYPAGAGAPTGPRSAWGGSSAGPAASSQGGSRGTSPSSSRPASPQPGASSSGGGAYAHVPSRYASPSAKRTTGPGATHTGSVSSNLSVNSINSAGNNHVVGAGASSSSRVYRHGSPAPNVSRTTPSAPGLAPRSSASGPSQAPVSRQHILASSGQGSSRALQGASIANSSVSSLGSGIVGAGNNNLSSSQRPSSTSGRYASPSAAQQAQPRRTSNASAASIYSAEGLQQQAADRARRSVNSSPMRGSTNSAALPSTGPRRYASPAPQQAPLNQSGQYDYDSLASGGSGNPRSRSGTPTSSSRATWKF